MKKAALAGGIPPGGCPWLWFEPSSSISMSISSPPPATFEGAPWDGGGGGNTPNPAAIGSGGGLFIPLAIMRFGGGTLIPKPGTIGSPIMGKRGTAPTAPTAPIGNVVMAGIPAIIAAVGGGWLVSTAYNGLIMLAGSPSFFLEAFVILSFIHGGMVSSSSMPPSSKLSRSVL